MEKTKTMVSLPWRQQNWQNIEKVLQKYKASDKFSEEIIFNLLNELQQLSTESTIKNEYIVLKKYFQNGEQHELNQFCEQTFKYIIYLALEGQIYFKESIEYNENEEIKLTRLQCAQLIACLFLGILRAQNENKIILSNEDLFSGDKVVVKITKLRFLLNYFYTLQNMQSTTSEVLQEIVSFNRNSYLQSQFTKNDIENILKSTTNKMINVECRKSENDQIFFYESNLNTYVINSCADIFAQNALGKYAYKFEVAAFKSPEILIGGILFQNQAIQDNQVISVRNVLEFSFHTGVTNFFNFVGSLNYYKTLNYLFVNPLDFRGKSTQDQFDLNYSLRETSKITNAVDLVEQQRNDPLIYIAEQLGSLEYAGEPQIKFICLWIAISLGANPESKFIYFTNGDTRLEELTNFIQEFKDKSIVEVYELLVKHQSYVKEEFHFVLPFKYFLNPL